MCCQRDAACSAEYVAYIQKDAACGKNCAAYIYSLYIDLLVHPVPSVYAYPAGQLHMRPEASPISGGALSVQLAATAPTEQGVITHALISAAAKAACDA